MNLELKTYRNSTELANLNGVPIYMEDMVNASLRGRLNVFLQGNTGSGKTQIVRDLQHYFGNKSLFILGRNDMDTRDLFQQVSPEFLAAIRSSGNKPKPSKNTKFKELTDKVNYNFIAVDELPNCVPAVRAQLFNLFDGFIEIDGKAYPIGSGYCVGMATGNIGQQFTESSNELGRALRDRMHLIVDVDYFRPNSTDTLEILGADRNPRVRFDEADLADKIAEIREAHESLMKLDVPFDKHLIALYLVHGLDYLDQDKYGGSKTALKSRWPNVIEGHEAGSDEALVLPVSVRAAKSIITLSQALDQITREKGAEELSYLDSMMTAFKFVGAHSGILNEALVRATYNEDHYKAMNAVVTATRTQFEEQKENIAAGMDMASQGKKDEKLLGEFTGRWGFMRNIMKDLAEDEKTT